jgi:hypothetical protein
MVRVGVQVQTTGQGGAERLSRSAREGRPAMYKQRSDTPHADPIAALVRYELDRRYREAEHLRLVAQARAASSGGLAPALALVAWVCARLRVGRSAPPVTPPDAVSAAAPEQGLSRI